MRTITVTLDGSECQIQELRSRDNAEWRKRLQDGPLAEIVEALKAAPNVDLTDGQALAGLVQSVSGVVLGSIDTMKELLVAYAPELDGQADEAYDSEIAEAFTAVLGLAYPFGVILKRMQVAGRKALQT